MIIPTSARIAITSHFQGLCTSGVPWSSSLFWFLLITPYQRAPWWSFTHPPKEELIFSVSLQSSNKTKFHAAPYNLPTLFVPRYRQPGESYPCHCITPFRVLQYTVFWYPSVIPITPLTHPKHSSWIINKVKKDSLHHPHSCLPLPVTHRPQDQFQDSITCLQSSNWSRSSIHLWTHEN